MQAIENADLTNPPPNTRRRTEQELLTEAYRGSDDHDEEDQDFTPEKRRRVDQVALDTVDDEFIVRCRDPECDTSLLNVDDNYCAACG